MKWSNSYLFTIKEVPADAEIPSHQLMIRAGYIRKVAQGIFSYGPMALRSIRKIENIVREELNKRNCIEILMPMVQPRELWEETNRWEEMGKGLLKFKNRLEQDFCLGATHEECVTDFVRRDIKSYRDLPKNLYQIQTKYRDEIRPRFGLLRGREFIMKDAYSFDLDEAAAHESYKLMHEAYTAIFNRMGVRYVVVKADSGNIGGSMSEEFHILAESGEDALLVSESGSFAANVEVCPARDAEPLKKSSDALVEREEFETPGLKTIEDLSKSLKVDKPFLVKTMFYSASDEEKKLKPICVLVRGSDEVNPIKLKSILGLANPPRLLEEGEIFKEVGAHPGSCGPVGLSMPIYMDHGVEPLVNFVVGANKDGYHLKNVNHGRDFKVEKAVDLRMAKDGDQSPDGRGLLRLVRGIEVGHIFYLGTKYSQAMNATYLNEGGKAQPIEMGCYGLGVSRTLQAVIEQNHDKDGIIWPVTLSPFHVHICLLDPQDPDCEKLANEIYEKLGSANIEVFVDDRSERPGVKFKDADLIGFPLRLNIGKRGVQAGEVEIVVRKTKEIIKVSTKASLETVVEKVKNWMKENGGS